METLLNAMANFGFPMVVTVYLLVKIEGRLDQLTASIYKLSETITTIRNSG
ncbi:YvrJ family protein [Alkalicella caledoniensis]|uniref:YvrJ family protein n=1 Tax=Alkalicella caledoniensis TaxID=2731377 RepID=A0A7G9W720_ALKCA|nr:YvrJ family protein [Alkalicella caledoniensis]QNO14482.1 YvrJ family protein [Alkalicella caledoniensis]